MKTKAIFWDRDGTLVHHNTNDRYTIHKNEIQLIEDVEVIASLQEEYLFFMITNAGGVGVGAATIEDFWAGQRYFEALCQEKGIVFERCWPAFWNPKNPNKYLEWKDWRKPATKMIKETHLFYPNLDLSQSWVVGDSNVDVELAHNAQLKSVFLQNPDNQAEYQQLKHQPTCKANNLKEVFEQIKNQPTG